MLTTVWRVGTAVGPAVVTMPSAKRSNTKITKSCAVRRDIPRVEKRLALKPQKRNEMKGQEIKRSLPAAQTAP